MPKIKQLSRCVKLMGSKTPINWYPGHMYGGMRAMIGKLATIDCVIEVHDARIPFIGRNSEFKQHLGSIKPHILVLNKIDLADTSNWRSIKQKLRDDGDENIITTDLTGTTFSQSNQGHQKLMQRVVGLINKSDRFNRATASNMKVMIVGIPNVGKSTLINRLRQLHLGLGGEASKTGPLAGVTRHVENMIKICARPPIYSIDTPGVLTPGSTRSHSQAMKLALCAAINDSQVDGESLATYLLDYFNKEHNHSYVQCLGLEGPAKDLQSLYQNATREDAKQNALRPWEKNTTFQNFCWFFVREFRKGNYGKVTFL